MWYWIIAGSIFLILEVLALLSFTPLKNKYEFFEFINHCCTFDDISSVAYTILSIIIAVFFPLVIAFIVSYFIKLFIIFVIKNLKRKN